jgi:hypothetical protein
MVIITNNAHFVVAFPYISLIVGVKSDFTKMIRIIVNHYGVECIIVNTVNKKIDIQDNKRLKCPKV